MTTSTVKQVKGVKGSLSVPDETKKRYALLYLEEALVKELYEVCVKWVDQAKRHGATSQEIEHILDQALNHHQNERKTT